MPKSGEVNVRLGLYKTLCCGCEIIIREGASFPHCPNHLTPMTIWNPVECETTDGLDKNAAQV